MIINKLNFIIVEFRDCQWKELPGVTNATKLDKTKYTLVDPVNSVLHKSGDKLNTG